MIGDQAEAGLPEGLAGASDCAKMTGIY